MATSIDCRLLSFWKMRHLLVTVCVCFAFLFFVFMTSGVVTDGWLQYTCLNMSQKIPTDTCTYTQLNNILTPFCLTHFIHKMCFTSFFSPLHTASAPFMHKKLFPVPAFTDTDECGFHFLICLLSPSFCFHFSVWPVWSPSASWRSVAPMIR